MSIWSATLTLSGLWKVSPSLGAIRTTGIRNRVLAVRGPACLNQRAGTPVKPKDYEGIRLYWAPKDINKTRERLKSLGYGVSELEHRDYGQTEFFLTDDDGYSHCFGVPTQR
jgi:hypothetical protein